MCDFEDAPVPSITLDPERTAERVPLEPVDAVTVTVLADNTADYLLPDHGPAQRPEWARSAGSVFENGFSLDAPRAEHGFSALLDVRRGEHTHRMLFDAGVTPTGMVENMARLDVAPDSIQAVVLSHGHWDHVGGLEGLMQRVRRTEWPLVIHPDFWRRRRVVIEGEQPFELPVPSQTALRESGFEIVERATPTLLFQRAVLVTGEVERTTGFEIGMRRQQAYLDGSWQPDPLVRDDQAVVLNLRDKGLVVLTGCGHAGIINILRHARHLTGIDRVHAVLGGFHLNGKVYDPILPQVCDELAEMAPDWLIPAHCSGPRANQAFAARFPQAWLPNTVGTRYVF